MWTNAFSRTHRIGMTVSFRNLTLTCYPTFTFKPQTNFHNPPLTSTVYSPLFANHRCNTRGQFIILVLKYIMLWILKTQHITPLLAINYTIACWINVLFSLHTLLCSHYPQHKLTLLREFLLTNSSENTHVAIPITFIVRNFRTIHFIYNTINITNIFPYSVCKNIQ